MIIGTWIVGLFLFTIILKEKTSFFNLLILNIYFSILGTAILSTRGIGSLRSFLLVTIAAIALLVGHYLGTVRNESKSLRLKSNSNLLFHNGALDDSTVYVLVCAVALITFYHLIVGGIPILSSRVEVARFNFNSSGLFGIPGRIFLYGVPFAWVVASANAKLKSIPWKSYNPWLIATGTLIISSISSGFKGDLFSALVLFLGAVSQFDSKRQMTFSHLIKRYQSLLFISLAYFFIVARQYRSYKLVDAPLWEQLFGRLTVSGAEPGTFLMGLSRDDYSNFSLVSDFQVLISKYTGLVLSDRITLERFVSIKLLGWDHVTTSYFAPPVTIGIFPETMFYFGTVFAILVMLIVGFTFARLEVSNNVNTLKTTAVILLQSLLSLIVIKGAVAYHILNVLLIDCIMLIFVFILNMTLKPKASNIPNLTSNAKHLT